MPFFGRAAAARRPSPRLGWTAQKLVLLCSGQRSAGSNDEISKPQPRGSGSALRPLARGSGDADFRSPPNRPSLTRSTGEADGVRHSSADLVISSRPAARFLCCEKR
jgi:hypothetical protein